MGEGEARTKISDRAKTIIAAAKAYRTPQISSTIDKTFSPPPMQSPRDREEFLLGIADDARGSCPGPQRSFDYNALPKSGRVKKSGAASVDLRLGSWFAEMRRSRASHLTMIGEVEGEDTRFLSKMHFVRFGDTFVLHPHQFILGVTLEWIRLPKDLAAYVTSRSSWGRRGLVINPEP